MTTRLLLALLLACLLPLPSLAQAPVEHAFLARVSVDAEGRVTDTELVKPVAEPLRSLVLETAAGIAFEPATRDGVAVPSRTALTLRMRFVPQGSDLRVELLSVTGGSAAVLETRMPRFPMEMVRDVRGMLALAELEVRPDGSVDLDASRVDRIEFYRDLAGLKRGNDRHADGVRRALLEAMAEWRFLVEEINGVAVGTRFPVPVTFCSAKRAVAGGSAEVCAEWRRAIRAEFERPTPADPAVRLAQPRLPQAAAPAA